MVAAYRNLVDLHVVPSVTLTREIQVPAGHIEGLGELLVEPGKLLAQFNFIGDIRCSLREAYSNRLFDLSPSKQDCISSCLHKQLAGSLEKWLTQIIFVKLTHVYGFCTGCSVPASHVNGPFSVKSPESDEHPGPPLNQMAISSFGSGLVVGKNQK